MKDILIIFAILLLLLITISTLGGSLSFVGNGRNEYFTDAPGNTVPIPKPTKQTFAQPHKTGPKTAAHTHTTPPATATAAAAAGKHHFTEKPPQKLTATTTSEATSGGTGGTIEPFEGPMYATA